MKNTPQDRQLVDVGGIFCQQASCILAVGSYFSGLLEENVAQVIFFKIKLFNLAGSSNGGKRNGVGHCVECLRSGVRIVCRCGNGRIVRRLGQTGLPSKRGVS